MEFKKIIKKIVDFDVEDKFYDKKEKKEVTKAITDLFDVDETEVRKFLEKWLKDTKKLADDMDLLSDDKESDDKEDSEEDYTPDDEEDITSDEEETAEPEMEDDVEESVNESLRNQANRYLM